MVKLEMLEVNGYIAQGICIQSPGGKEHPNMLVILCKKGYIMCGYLNQEAAAKFGDAAVVIGGSCFNEILDNQAKGLSPEAEKLGIEIGMTGRQVIEKLSI